VYFTVSTLTVISLLRGDRSMENFDVFVERQVLDVELRSDRFRRMADGHQHVGLPQPRATINEERVVGRARILRDGAAGRDGQTVGGPHDERLERESRIEGARHAAGLPVASFLRTNSETAFNVSNTPLPCSASAGKLGTLRKLSASSGSAWVRISSGGRSWLLYCMMSGIVRTSTPCSSRLLWRFCRLSMFSSSCRASQS